MGVAWGFLSTANINRKVLAGARLSDRVGVVAVASRDRDRAETWARANGVERAYGSYEELLSDAEVEAVYISLPNSLHVEWAIRALQAGKHVLCEKPLTRLAAEAERAFAAAEEADRILTEAFMYRHHPQTRRLAELMAEGAVGRLQVVRAVFSFPVQGGANVRLDAALDGGALMDVGCYCVSGARLLAGEPQRVYGEAVPTEGAVDGLFAGTLAFPDGVFAHFHCGLFLQHQDELEAIGDEGSIFLDDPWHCREPLIELRRADGVERISIEEANPYRLELENVSDAIRGNARPLLGREDAVGQARVLEALYRSAAEGAPVQV
jgi:D-xylose 1-dehydrogenase (NADP+, D-xylono-1,5-lactone-forming)